MSESLLARRIGLPAVHLRVDGVGWDSDPVAEVGEWWVEASPLPEAVGPRFPEAVTA